MRFFIFGFRTDLELRIPNDLQWKPKFLHVRSRRGKGRGSSSNNGNSHNNIQNDLAGSIQQNANLVNNSLSAAKSIVSDSTTCSRSPHLSITDNQLDNFESSCFDPSDDSLDVESNHGPDFGHKRRRGRPLVSNEEGQDGLVENDSNLLATNNQQQQQQPHPHQHYHQNLAKDDKNIYAMECQLLYDVEALEDKVISSSLQVKGWQVSVCVCVCVENVFIC